MSLALGLVLLFAGMAAASDTDLSGFEGHPRSRFPLALHAAPAGEAPLDAAVARAVSDWNAVARETLGVAVFAPARQQAEAHVVVTFAASATPGLMGETVVHASGGVVTLPVRIEIVPPQTRGQTSRETLLYQVVAHELGHALGLEHVRDPASVMCCVPGSVDFKDPATRRAYVEARRHPDVRSAPGQLKAHYARFWATPGADGPEPR